MIALIHRLTMASREDAKERANRSAEYRNKVEERKGTEWYDNARKGGLQDATENGRYSAAEVISEMRSGRDGKTTEQMADYYQGLADSGTTFNNRAKSYLSERHGVNFGGGGKPETQPDKPETEPEVPSNQDQESAERYRQSAVNAVTNTQSTGSIAGNNNTINQNQETNIDNSTTYEGNKSNITIGGTVGSPEDTTMTKLSIAQAANPNPNDSGKGGAAWVNYWKDAGSGLKYNDTADDINKQAQAEVDDLQVMDTSALNTQLNNSIQGSYDRALLGKINTYGDIYHKDYKAPTFENGTIEDVEQPDFEKMYNDLKNSIK